MPNYIQSNPQRIDYWQEECIAAIELGHAQDARNAAPPSAMWSLDGRARDHLRPRRRPQRRSP